eukprot:gene1166-4384_t
MSRKIHTSTWNNLYLLLLSCLYVIPASLRQSSLRSDPDCVQCRLLPEDRFRIGCPCTSGGKCIESPLFPSGILPRSAILKEHIWEMKQVDNSCFEELQLLNCSNGCSQVDCETIQDNDEFLMLRDSLLIDLRNIPVVHHYLSLHTDTLTTYFVAISMINEIGTAVHLHDSLLAGSHVKRLAH